MDQILGFFGEPEEYVNWNSDQSLLPFLLYGDLEIGLENDRDTFLHAKLWMPQRDRRYKTPDFKICDQVRLDSGGFFTGMEMLRFIELVGEAEIPMRFFESERFTYRGILMETGVNFIFQTVPLDSDKPIGFILDGIYFYADKPKLPEIFYPTEVASFWSCGASRLRRHFKPPAD